MGRRLYVGNLPYKATDEELTALFSTVGDVASARVMRDMATGRARGFGFVEMTTDEAAAKAIERLHQHQMDGRAIVVNEAQPKPAGGRHVPAAVRRAVLARHGVIGQRERAYLVEGEVRVDSAPGKGTRVELRVPVPRP